MDPATLALIARLIPALMDGVSEGTDIVKRLMAGDTDAVAQAEDWLGITAEVSDAIDAWEKSTGKQ